MLDGCKQGIPRIRPYTESLIRRMLTVYAAFQYEVWAYNDKLTDEELLKLGMPTDDEESLVRYCRLSANDAVAIEKRKCHTAQQKVIKAFFNYVKASATFAKEIKSEKGVDRWVRAFAIVVRYDKDAEQPPYTTAAMDEVFSLISQANDETYVTWMIPELPTLAEGGSDGDTLSARRIGGVRAADRGSPHSGEEVVRAADTNTNINNKSKNNPTAMGATSPKIFVVGKSFDSHEPRLGIAGELMDFCHTSEESDARTFLSLSIKKGKEATEQLLNQLKQERSAGKLKGVKKMPAYVTSRLNALADKDYSKP